MASWIVRSTVRGTAALVVGAVLAIGLPDARVAAPAAVVFVAGDLSSAARIAVLVPGADTTPANFHGGLGGVLRRSPAWQARQLASAAGARTAAVAWLGYETPRGIGRTAIRSERAASAASSLVSFVDGLAAAHPEA